MLDLQSTKKLFEILEEIRVWIKIIGFPKLSEVVKDTLQNKTEKQIYEASDGSKSSRQIARKFKISHISVVRLWRHWHSLGLVEESPKYKGRYQHVISLRNLGIRLVKRKAVKQKGAD